MRKSPFPYEADRGVYAEMYEQFPPFAVSPQLQLNTLENGNHTPPPAQQTFCLYPSGGCNYPLV
jgi:hypothetical protein